MNTDKMKICTSCTNINCSLIRRLRSLNELLKHVRRIQKLVDKMANLMNVKALHVQNKLMIFASKLESKINIEKTYSRKDMKRIITRERWKLKRKVYEIRRIIFLLCDKLENLRFGSSDVMERLLAKARARTRCLHEDMCNYKNKYLWGELDSDDSESESEESKKEVDDDNEIAIDVDGLVTSSGNISIAEGIETPDIIELRKLEIEKIDIVDAPCLYTILPEKKIERISGVMASTHVYEINGKRNDGVDLEKLNMGKGIIEARYEESMQVRRNKDVKEDFSDMVAEHVVKQNFKRKRKANDVDPNLKSKKKLKGFEI